MGRDAERLKESAIGNWLRRTAMFVGLAYIAYSVGDHKTDRGILWVGFGLSFVGYLDLRKLIHDVLIVTNGLATTGARLSFKACDILVDHLKDYLHHWESSIGVLYQEDMTAEACGQPARQVSTQVAGWVKDSKLWYDCFVEHLHTLSEEDQAIFNEIKTVMLMVQEDANKPWPHTLNDDQLSEFRNIWFTSLSPAAQATDSMRRLNLRTGFANPMTAEQRPSLTSRLSQAALVVINPK